jgi:transposase
MSWVSSQQFNQPAQTAMLVDYLHEVEHARDRMERLERAIDAVLEAVAPQLHALIDALQALRAVAKLTAVTVVAEVGTFLRFSHPRLLMDYIGMVSSEYSSGGRMRRGCITKSGNSRLRRILAEAAWNYIRRPAVTRTLRRRQEGLSEEVKVISWKAQQRLDQRYFRLLARGKSAQRAVVAVARELTGFIWAIGVSTERSAGNATPVCAVRHATVARGSASRRKLMLRLEMAGKGSRASNN